MTVFRFRHGYALAMKKRLVLIILISLCGGIFGSKVNKYTWGSWSRVSCARSCDQPSGTASPVRHCQYCEDRHRKPCIRSQMKQCTHGSSKKTEACYVANHCKGAGIYTGEWSPWDQTRKCPVPEHTCRGEYDGYTRTCIQRRGKIFKCPGQASKSDMCRCRKKQPPLRQVSPKSNRYGRWTHWTEWRCTEDCGPNVKAARHRDCLDYAYDYFCRPDNVGKFDLDISPCRVGDNLVCLKSWGAWESWSACAKSCGDMEVRNRKRPCVGSGAQCTGKGSATGRCPSSRSCPYKDGGWGTWGAWSDQCSASCGTGMLQRIRKCNRPVPRGRGRMCSGEDKDTKPCRVAANCLVDGGWSAWTTWMCGSACGGDRNIRRRLCNNPLPQIGGQPCSGQAAESLEGCKSSPCPVWENKSYKDKYLKAMMSLNLRLQHTSYKLSAGDVVQFNCDNEVTRFLMQGYPTATIQWIHNGMTFSVDPQRMAYKETSLEIRNAEASDSGVYMCQIDYFIEKPHIVGVFSLAVASDKGIEISAGSNIDINCLGGSLGNVFHGVHQLWLQDGVPRPEGVTPLRTDREYMNNVSESLNGKWECQVMDQKNGRLWSTNQVLISVTPSAGGSNVAGGLTGMVDMAKTVNPMYAGAGVGGVLVVVIIIVVVVCCCKKSDDYEAVPTNEKEANLTGRRQNKERDRLRDNSC